MGFCMHGPWESTGQIWSPYSFIRSWDNKGYFKTLGSPWIRPRSLLPKIFNGLLFGWTLWMCRPNLKSVALPVPELIAYLRLFKVTDFGTNRKRVCDFLLVHNSNIGPILHRFGYIAGFLCSRVTPPLFHPNFGGVPVAPDGPCWGQPEQRPEAIRPWNYFWRIPTYVITIPERHTRTDGQYTIAIPCVALKCIAR